MTREEAQQRLIRQYKEQTGQDEVDMREVAQWALANSYQTVRPFDPVDLLAKQFSKSARAETRIDEATGRPYRANLAVRQPGTQAHLWIDIDQATRGQVHRALVQRREQIVSDAVQLTNDCEHWSRVHPDEDPIQLPLDFTFDVELRRHAYEEAPKKLPPRHRA